jgi:hypothetical protein
MKCLRGEVGSIGGGSPLLNWMPLDWLQEDLSTPTTIGYRWGSVWGLRDVLPDYRVRQRARGAKRPAVGDARSNQAVGLVRAQLHGACYNLPTGCFLLNSHYWRFVFDVALHQGNGEFPELIPTQQMCDKQYWSLLIFFKYCFSIIIIIIITTIIIIIV